MLEQAALAVPAEDGGLLESHMAASWQGGCCLGPDQGSTVALAYVRRFIVSRPAVAKHTMRSRRLSCLMITEVHCC